VIVGVGLDPSGVDPVREPGRDDLPQLEGGSPRNAIGSGARRPEAPGGPETHAPRGPGSQADTMAQQRNQHDDERGEREHGHGAHRSAQVSIRIGGHVPLRSLHGLRSRRYATRLAFRIRKTRSAGLHEIGEGALRWAEVIEQPHTAVVSSTDDSWRCRRAAKRGALSPSRGGVPGAGDELRDELHYQAVVAVGTALWRICRAQRRRRPSRVAGWHDGMSVST